MAVFLVNSNGAACVNSNGAGKSKECCALPCPPCPDGTPCPQRPGPGQPCPTCNCPPPSTCLCEDGSARPQACCQPGSPIYGMTGVGEPCNCNPASCCSLNVLGFRPVCECDGPGTLTAMFTGSTSSVQWHCQGGTILEPFTSCTGNPGTQQIGISAVPCPTGTATRHMACESDWISHRDPQGHFQFCGQPGTGGFASLTNDATIDWAGRHTLTGNGVTGGLVVPLGGCQSGSATATYTAAAADPTGSFSFMGTVQVTYSYNRTCRRCGPAFTQPAGLLYSSRESRLVVPASAFTTPHPDCPGCAQATAGLSIGSLADAIALGL